MTWLGLWVLVAMVQLALAGAATVGWWQASYLAMRWLLVVALVQLISSVWIGVNLARAYVRSAADQSAPSVVVG